MYQNRFCNQEYLHLVVSGERKFVRNIYKASYPDCTKIEILDSRSEYDDSDKTRTSGSSIWTISIHGYENSNSPTKCGHTMRRIQLPDKRRLYNACFYMKSIYVLGGFCDFKYIRTCVKYDTKTSKWSYIAIMNKRKRSAAAIVFEGKIVVLGGTNQRKLTLVEAYDYYENKWTLLPDMIIPRCGLGAVSMGNKFFVIGGCLKSLNNEVFDSVSRRFTMLKVKPLTQSFMYSVRVAGVGYNIFVFRENSSPKEILVYNVLKDHWEYKDFDHVGVNEVYCCSRLCAA